MPAEPPDPAYLPPFTPLTWPIRPWTREYIPLNDNLWNQRNWRIRSIGQNPLDDRERRSPVRDKKGVPINKALATHVSPKNESFIGTFKDPVFPDSMRDPQGDAFFLGNPGMHYDLEFLVLQSVRDWAANTPGLVAGANPKSIEEARAYYRRGRFYSAWFASNRVPCMDGVVPKSGLFRGDPNDSIFTGSLHRVMTEHCPNMRWPAKFQNPGGYVPPKYTGQIRPCSKGTNCKIAASLRNRGAWQPPFHLAFVCQEHIERQRLCVRQDRWLDSFRLGVCAYHLTRYQKKYPQGVNTCVCEADLNRWLCHWDYEETRKNIAECVRYRLPKSYGMAGAPQPWGGVNNAWMAPCLDRTSSSQESRPMTWEWEFEGTRIGGLTFQQHAHLTHPCSLGCGRPRMKQRDVLDCRACGGLIVQPDPKAKKKKKTKPRKRPQKIHATESEQLMRLSSLRKRPKRDEAIADLVETEAKKRKIG